MSGNAFKIARVAVATAVMMVATPVLAMADINSAHTADSVTSIVIETSTGSANRSTLRLTFSAPISKEKARSIQTAARNGVVEANSEAIASRSAAAQQSSSAIPAAQGPVGEAIWCNGHYWWSDTDGRYDIQRLCNGSKAPWGLKLSAYTQSIVAGSGYVQELGLEWKRNGVQQGKMAPHTEYKNYQFHGTYSGISNGTSVSYQDVIGFPCNLGPGCQATVSFYGSHWFSATVWHP